jgi:aryl-alcohol dehydrogenase-like predicted oxidoreductase
LGGERGIGLFVHSPLAQELLTGKFLQRVLQQQEQSEEVQKLAPIAEKLGLSMPPLAPVWCLRRSEASSVIIGASRPSQVEDSVGAPAVNLSEDVVAEIEAVL